MSRKKLTILTEPIDLHCNVRSFVFRRIGWMGEYGGHSQTTQRLVEGMKEIGFDDFNYQPKSIKDVGENIHVMARVETLEWAIELKKKGVIKKLTAGPNVVVFSDEHDSIIADENVDMFLQPSQWAADLHMEVEPRLKGRCVGIPFGGIKLDDEIYTPNYNRRHMALVYQKEESIHFAYRVQHMLQCLGYETAVIEYGKYKYDDYIDLLKKCEFMVTVGRQESGGFFLTEAWALDVPTICFDPHYYKWTVPYEREVSGNISTCPYLSETTGVRFYEMHELEEILSEIDAYKQRWHPRKWVEENMTQAICARKFLEAVGLE